MPYDIYGNPLRQGYCEVHPDVPEEYPCSVCFENYQGRQEQEPRQPEPTVMEYIGFDTSKFKTISDTIVDAANKNDEDAFYASAEELVRALDPEFVYSILQKIK